MILGRRRAGHSTAAVVSSTAKPVRIRGCERFDRQVAVSNPKQEQVMSDAESYNPYAPPTASVASVGAAASGLKRRNLVVMFLLIIVTLGIYYPVWFFRRRPGLNRLDSPRKL